jgi:hypothetical protein
MSRRAPARASLSSATFVAAFALVATALTSPPARAKASIQAITTTSAGWTDNILNAPDEKTTTGPARENDFFFQLQPGAVVASGSPRFLQRLQYTFTADLFVTHTEANSYSNALEWAADVLTSSTTTLVLTMLSLQGRLSTFALNQQSSGATVAVLPANANINYFSQTATETLEWTPTTKWRFSEVGLFRAFIPIDRGLQPDVYDASAELAFDRLFRIDAVGLVLRSAFVEYVPPRDPTTNVAVPDTRQDVTTLLARWRRDWTPFWSSEAALGVVVGVGASDDPTVPSQTVWEPSALAALRYTHDLGNGELRYVHDVTPNPLAGSTFSMDEVALQGGLPIVRAKMFLGATAAYQHARLLPLAQTVAPASADLVLIDFTIGWQPRPEIGLFARYSFYDQFGSPPVMDVQAPLPDLTRQTVLVGVNIVYPAVAAARVATRRGARVDQSDQAGFPELHAPQPR